jgi:hypothetical protein
MDACVHLQVGCGCYQDRIALLGAGALELMVQSAVGKIVEWCYDCADPPPPMLL